MLGICIPDIRTLNEVRMHLAEGHLKAQFWDAWIGALFLPLLLFWLYLDGGRLSAGQCVATQKRIEKNRSKNGVDDYDFSSRFLDIRRDKLGRKAFPYAAVWHRGQDGTEHMHPTMHHCLDRHGNGVCSAM